MNPVQSMLEKMRESRHNGRGVLPTVLRLGFQPPVTYQEGIKAVEEYVPEESKRGGMFAPQWSRPGTPQQAMQVNEVIGDSDPVVSAFSSLSGNRTARHDLKGNRGMRYPDRMLATDSDAPDQGYSRPDRIDGQDPIRGGAELPEPVYETPTHKLLADTMSRLKRYEAQLEGVRDPRQAAVIKTQYSMANNEAAGYQRQIDAAAAKAQQGLAPAVNQLQPILEEAVRTGNFGAYDAAAISMFGKTDKDGMPLDPVAYTQHGRRTAEVPILMNARAALQQHNGLAGAPPETALAVTKGLAYVYPFTPKNPADVNERRVYIQQLSLRLNSQLNQSRDPQMKDYLDALAAATAYNQHPW